MRVASDSAELRHRGGGWLHRLDDAGPPERPRRPGRQAEAGGAPEAADAATRDRVYCRLLELATLSLEHRCYLIEKCGLPAEAPTAGRFGTLPRDCSKIVSTLETEFSRATLLAVPGFVERQGRLRLSAGAGLLVAVHDAAGRVVGCQVRVGPGDYRWLSGAGGPSSGAPVHVARPAERRDRRVYIVESTKTAEVLAHRLGAIAIGLAGFGNWRAAQPALEALAGEAEGVVIALDAAPADDDITAKRLADSRASLAALAVAAGYAARIATWPAGAGKGPDDLLLAGGQWTISVHRPGSAGAAGGGTVGGDSFALEALLDTRLKPGPARVLAAIRRRAGEPGTETRCSLRWLAGASGLSESTASRILADLASAGFLRVEHRPLGDDGATALWVTCLPSPSGDADEIAARMTRRRADAARKRCPSCGGRRLAATLLYCRDCGHHCNVAEAECAGQRDIVTLPDGRRVDRATGEVLSKTRPRVVRRAERLAESASRCPDACDQPRPSAPARGALAESASQSESASDAASVSKSASSFNKELAESASRCPDACDDGASNRCIECAAPIALPLVRCYKCVAACFNARKAAG